jgi:large subunit ribosomal protein L2
LVLLAYANGVLSYILGVKDLKYSAIVSSGPFAQISPGCATTFKRIPIGQVVCNIENKIGMGGTFIHSAGTKAQILRKTKKFAILKLPSGELRAFNKKAYATIGALEQPSPFFIHAKSRRYRWLGNRPIVEVLHKPYRSSTRRW